jgi:hypothetical protein
MNIGVRPPAIDKNGSSIRQRDDPVADDEMGIAALNLKQDVAMRMRVADQRRVHIEQRDPPERTMGDP